MTVTANDLPRILAAHVKWLAGEPDGSRADLSRADLRDAVLSGADLSCADLSGADLSGADLSGADLRDAVLSGADLRDANLRDAYLRGADLGDAFLPDFQIPQDGSLIVWKAVEGGIARIEVPAEAKRTACLINRKCRAEFVRTLEIIIDGETTRSAPGRHDRSILYIVGEITRPDSYDDNPAVDCTHGIHFFLTRKDAEEW